MRRILKISLVAALLIHGSFDTSSFQTARGQASEMDGSSRFVIIAALDAFDDLQRADYRGAQSRLTALTEAPQFEQVSDKLKREVYSLLRRAVRQRIDPGGAYEITIKITQLSSGNSNDWFDRIDLATQLGEYEDSVYSLIELVSRWPELLDTVNVSFLSDLLASLRAETDRLPDYDRLLGLLLDYEWDDAEAFIAIDREWYRNTLFLLGQGQTDLAVQVARRVRYVPVLISMRVDRRFDALASVDAGIFDVDLAVDREIDTRRQSASRFSDDLSVTTSLANALRRGNRAEEALEILNSAARPRRNPGVETASGWADEFDAMHWFMNERADVLWQLGLRQNAIAQLQEARTANSQPGSYHIDQSINLGTYLAISGDSDRARTIVSDLEQLTDFGEMYVRYVRLVSAVHDDDLAGINRELLYMSRNSKDGPYLYQRGLIISGRLDEAAEYLEYRLADPDRRAGALVDIQTYLDDLGGFETTELESRYAENKRKLLSNINVREAVDEVGRVESFATWFTPFSVAP